MPTINHTPSGAFLDCDCKQFPCGNEDICLQDICYTIGLNKPHYPVPAKGDLIPRCHPVVLWMFDGITYICVA